MQLFYLTVGNGKDRSGWQDNQRQFPSMVESVAQGEEARGHEEYAESDFLSGCCKRKLLSGNKNWIGFITEHCGGNYPTTFVPFCYECTSFYYTFLDFHDVPEMTKKVFE